jgi:hypothetical protein
MNKVLCFLTIFILSASAVFAAVIGQTDESTRIGGGARPVGMGRAFVAVSDDSDAIFINPAGSAGMKGPQAMAMFTNILNDVYYTEFCGAVPSEWGVFGMGYIATGVNDVPTTPEASDYYDGMLVLSYSSSLARFFEYSKNVYFGSTIKLFSRGWSGGVNDYGSGWSSDFGIKYIYSPYLSFGLVRQNFVPVSLGSKLTFQTGVEESVSGSTNIGVAYRTNLLKDSLLFSLEADLPSYSGQQGTEHAGVEWKLNDYIAIRGGSSQYVDADSPTGTSWNPSYGISFGYLNLRVDYAYITRYNDPAQTTHYLSLSYSGEPWLALKGETAPLNETPSR